MRSATVGPRVIEGARAPFFEKLLGAAQDAAPGALYDAEGLAGAVSASLRALLATRAGPDAARRGPAERLVVDYGVPSLEQFAPSRPDDRARLADAMRDAILAFEPRLERPEVSVVPDPAVAGRLEARVTGWLRLSRTLEAFTFSGQLDFPA
ncbi:type VI secretion system baseplate subunit TssE [Rubrimonas cliftonensis]|uniref:Type VI secretion system protein ImpF n=1 Tax=Rubrimonas cliftonensis TaxID=89524 RepID=A0A1H3WV41_9RHOB|nr:type VI secretion system baseplate subunit TssE [Rubrimonas cliftonensis]SDZ90222.1 type VI secretion system protein ImpF [Rubrimonas cliftonensis]